MTDLANRLIDARTKKGMTQEDLAKAAGVSQSTIGNLESRIRHTARKLAVIAHVLGVNAYWLETGKGSPQEQPADDLLAQVAALSPAERGIVAALVTSLRGVSVGARPDASGGVGAGDLNDYEKRVLSLVRQLDDHGRRDAQTNLETMVAAIKDFKAQSEGLSTTSRLGLAGAQTKRRKS